MLRGNWQFLNVFCCYIRGFPKAARFSDLVSLLRDGATHFFAVAPGDGEALIAVRNYFRWQQNVFEQVAAIEPSRHTGKIRANRAAVLAHPMARGTLGGRECFPALREGT